MGKTKEEIEAVTKQLVDSTLTVHRALGPGLLESTYQTGLAFELRSRRIEVQCKVELPVIVKGLDIETENRSGMLVAGCILVENKSVPSLAPIHEAQLLTYLRVSGRRLGFLVNWNSPLIKDGIKPMVNKLLEGVSWRSPSRQQPPFANFAPSR
ncbi:MAG: GxxExxY protein [Pirellulaceae bacterium]|nr:GxxExxY protein [Pirellulaceae bacterium]